jgi:hypothetical protein
VETDTLILNHLGSTFRRSALQGRLRRIIVAHRNPDRRRDESGQARIGLILDRRLTGLEPGLLVVAEVALGTGPTIGVRSLTVLLIVAILEGTVRTRAAILAFVLAILAFTTLLALALRLTLLGLEARLRRIRLRRRGVRLRLVGLLHGLRRALDRRGETVGDAALVVILFLGFRFADLADVARLSLLLGLLSRCNDPEVVFSVLEIALGHNRVAGGLGVARELQVFLGHVMGCAPDLHIRPVGFIGPGKRIRPLAITTTTTRIIVVAAAYTLVLTRSHR